MSNSHYIYVWKERGVAGSGLPFYVGQGKHQINKYQRAYSYHKGGKNGSYCQNVADKLRNAGTPHIVEILYDNLTKSQANEMEKTLIERLGRRCTGNGILTNLTEGGDSNPMDNPEIRNRQLSYMTSDENRRRASRHTKRCWENEEYRKNQLSQNRLETVNKERKIPVEVNGVKYESIYEASQRLGIPSETIRKRLIKNLPVGKDSSYYNPISHSGIEYRNSAQLCRILGINYSTFKTRIRNGVPVEEAVMKGLERGR